MVKPTAQACHALTTYFTKKYNEVVGKTLVFNRNKARWGFESVLMDYNAEQARELIDFYLNHFTDTPTVDGFLYNYDKVDIAKQDYENNQKVQAARREATKRRLEEWEARWKK